MPLLSIGNHIQKPLKDKEISTLLEEIVSKGVPLVVEHVEYTDARLFSKNRIIEWYHIYHKIDEAEFQCLNLNGTITKEVCLAYLYGYLNGLNKSK